MQVYKCDACGAIYETENYFTTKPFFIKGIKIKLKLSIYSSLNDLCPYCISLLLDQCQAELRQDKAYKKALIYHSTDTSLEADTIM